MSNALLTRTDPALKRRLYLMMFLQYFVQGSYLPVITEYIRSGLNFTPSEMGMFSAAIAVGPLIAPFIIGQLVDRHYATQHVLAFCHFAGAIIMLSLYWLTGFWPIVVMGALYSALYIPSMMLTNSLTFHHLVDREHEFPRIRLWGTIGFVIPAWTIEPFFLSGLEGSELDQARGIVLIFAGISGLVMGAYSLTLPHTPPSAGDKKDIAPGTVIRLMRHRNFLALVLISLLVAVSHKYFFVWNSPFVKAMLERVTTEGSWVQRISSIGQIAEVAVMAGLGFSIHRYGFKRVMVIGALAYMIRCLVFSLAVLMEDQLAASIGLVCLGQALHGFCFGCFLAAAYMYVDQVAPKDVRGSMQTFYGTFIIGAGMFAGGLIAGWIGESFETEIDETTLRSRLGIATRTGIMAFSRTKDNVELQLNCDWLGVWLSGAIIAAIAFVAFATLFPNEREDADQS